MKYLSLFSGIGGFELAIQSVCPNWKCVGYSEVDKYAEAIYNYHFPNNNSLGDVSKIKTHKLPNFQLLTFGFPCPSFSVCGKQTGFSDTRGALFFEAVRILKDKKPSYFLFENVKGLLSNKSRRTFQTVIKTLTEIGYCVEWEVCNSRLYVPQNRERVFAFGSLGGPTRQQIFPIGANRRPYPKKLSSTTIDANYWKGIGNHGSRTGIINLESNQTRKLTPLECERLQGLPDNFTKYGQFADKIKKISDSQRYKVIGNAVTVPVVKDIISSINNVIASD